jgi:N-acetylglucosamine repressor
MKNNATNSTQMKFSNRWLILNIVRKNPVSRAEIARITMLTRAAVTIIVDELINDGVLIETGTAEANYGRKPVLLDLNPKSYYFLGLSITRDGSYIGVINIKGILLIKQEITLESSLDVYACLKIIVEAVKKIIDHSALPHEKFLGMGVCTPGPVDINKGIILNPPNFSKWHNLNIVRELKQSFAFDIFLENNSTSLTLMEKNYGRGAVFGNFMLLVVDTGIGAGMIINDNLYRGVGGFGCEVGHTSIDINGTQCSCGNKGCLEVYASIPAVLDAIRKRGQSRQTWSEVVDGAINDNDVCSEAVDREARYLSAGIINAMNILELEAVILTGDVNYKPEMLIDRIRKNVSRLAITRHIHELQVLNSSVEENSEVISAAAIIIEKFFKGEIKTDK